MVALAVLIVLLLVIISLAGVAIVRARAYYHKYRSVRPERLLISDVYRTLKTGDIILFIASVHDFTNSLLTRNVFSHAGVVVEDGGKQFISESGQGQGPDCAPGHHRRDGAGLSPLLARLKHYRGQAFLMRLSAPLDPAGAGRLKDAARVEFPYPSTAKLISGILFNDKSTRHCFQHVGELLDAAGLTPPEGPFAARGYFGVSTAISELPGKPLREGLYYMQPRQLVYDLDAIE